MGFQLNTAIRQDGQEQPGIKMGLFTLRLPLIHFPIEMPEVIQALFMFVTGLSATAFLQDMFDMPFEVALTIVLFHEITYCLHQLMGDPIISGWITPAIPLTIAYLGRYGIGMERLEALIALQMSVGVLFLILGLSGMAQKITNKVPNSIKAGIIMGAAVAAVTGKYGFLSAAKGGKGFALYPYSITAGMIVAFFLLFSVGFKEMRLKVNNKSGSFIGFVAKYGMVPGIIAGMVTGIISKEIPMPVIDNWGFFIPHFKTVFTSWSVFGVGIPSLDVFLAAMPMAFVAYIIAFGDIIVGESLLKRANKIRTDEYIDVNTNRTNVLCGLRNMLEGLLAPTVTLAGPLWAAMTVAVTERYCQGKKAMSTIFGGTGTFNIMKFACILFLPLVAVFKPVLPLAIALTLMVQAFACFFIAMELAETPEERGVAGVTGAILAVGGPTYGLAAGVILYFFVQWLRPAKDVDVVDSVLEEAEATK
ncbi:hypothetical protein [Desulforhopalus singaporensis]|uniref:Permease family protein n=1 Tax=Desulforhopalus singaporensis TaxID=91360 RepID=A0A1H0T743_9BACT|nr:hypothetical protein [Desulforhopalus singaporensis]SDP49862.1 hypothetical protein SAMN05660330_02963 [Desulforhopalus singaporensis]